MAVFNKGTKVTVKPSFAQTSSRTTSLLIKAMPSFFLHLLLKYISLPCGDFLARFLIIHYSCPYFRTDFTKLLISFLFLLSFWHISAHSSLESLRIICAGLENVMIMYAVIENVAAVRSELDKGKIMTGEFDNVKIMRGEFDNLQITSGEIDNVGIMCGDNGNVGIMCG